MGSAGHDGWLLFPRDRAWRWRALPHPQGSLLLREQMKGEEWREGQASRGRKRALVVVVFYQAGSLDP